MMSALPLQQPLETLAVDFDRIPAFIKDRHDWVLWQRIQKSDGKWTKPPYQVGGKLAKTNDPDTWISLADARKAYGDGEFDGVGVVLRDGLVGIDLDHVLNESGNLELWAKEILERFAATYAELSPSRDGFHILVRGKLARCGKAGPQNRLEFYDGSSPRYFTVTGHEVSDECDITEQQEALDWLRETYFPDPTANVSDAKVLQLTQVTAVPSTDDDILTRAARAGNGDKFRKLFDHGDYTGYASQSEAELALANMLSYWTQDGEQLDRLFQKSALYRADKWNEPHSADGATYGQMTIEMALASKSAQAGADAIAKLDRKSSTTPSESGINIPIVHIGDLLSKPKRISWLIEGILSQNTLNQVFGPSASGKSFVAIDWACSVATGTPWNGHKVEKGPVFYIAGEGEDGLALRVAAWEQERGCTIGKGPLFVIPQAMALLKIQNSQALCDKLDLYVETHGSPRLIVIDTLARNFGDGDENSASDVGLFIEHIDVMRRKFGCAVLIVHHSGKSDKGQARGSTALRGAMHHEYSVDDTGGRRVLRCTKNKEGAKPPDMNFRLEEIELDDCEDNPVTSAVPVWSEAATEKKPADDLTPSARIALKVLRDETEFKGIPPDLDLIAAYELFPPDAVVREKQWKDAAIAAGISSGNESSRSTTFRRAKKELIEKGLVRSHGDSYWPK